MNVIESYFWLGEIRMEMKNFKGAATAFLESFSRSPSNPFVWKSLLGLAEALGELGQTEQGCLTIVELESRFPEIVVSNRDEVEIVTDQLKCFR